MRNIEVVPEKCLLGAVLDRAIRDAVGSEAVIDAKKIAAAREWFRDDCEVEWTLVWICDHLGLDHVRVRRVVFMLIERHKTTGEKLQKSRFENAIARYVADEGDEYGIPGAVMPSKYG